MILRVTSICMCHILFVYLRKPSSQAGIAKLEGIMVIEIVMVPGT